MDKEQIEENIEQCNLAEKNILDGVAPFLEYWKIVDHAKKQVSIIRKQRRHLEEQLKKDSFPQ